MLSKDVNGIWNITLELVKKNLINLCPCSQTGMLVKAKVTSELFQRLTIRRIKQFFHCFSKKKSAGKKSICFKIHEKSQLNLSYTYIFKY